MRVRKLAPTLEPANPQIVAAQKQRSERRSAATRSLLASEKTTKNVTPISDRPDLANHPAMRMPLTFRYANPIGAGGWLGGIEPANEEWIAFVAIDGETLLWEQRETDGGVIGKPVLFYRKDLIPRSPIATQKLRCEKATFSLDASAADGRFLIFAEGKIKTDYGLSVMTPEAGAAIVKAFRARGNDMPIDLRHGMVKDVSSLEESLAYGWIPCPEGLEYVKGKGLYAKNVQWDPRVKAALQAKPPQIKYHSPAYTQDPKTGVIISLDNVAITNLPATHNLQRMAAERRRTSMDLGQIGKALAAAMSAAAAGDQQAVAIRDSLIAGLGEQAEAALDAAGLDTGPDSQMAAVEPDKPEMQAESASEPDVKAEASSDDGKAEGVTAEALLLMARGAEQGAVATREKVLAENAHLIPRSPALMKMLGTVTDKVLADFLTARKADVAKTTIRVDRTRASIQSKKPETRASVDVPAAVKAEAARVAKMTGTDLKKVLAELVGTQNSEAT